MRSLEYWKRYPVETDPEVIAARLRTTRVVDADGALELVSFPGDHGAPAILISQGTAGHAYVFAELGYHMNARGYHVFIMPRHGGRTIDQLVARHERVLGHIARVCSDRIGIFSEVSVGTRRSTSRSRTGRARAWSVRTHPRSSPRPASTTR